MRRRQKSKQTEVIDQASLTLQDHLHELQGRLFAIAIAFIAFAALSYPFFDKITEIIVAPLKDGQDLVYLTPAGAFSFIIKICMYLGIIGALPVIVFNIYRFVMPAVKQTHLRSVVWYTVFSVLLALAGVVFAYYVSLPASLYFLTSFDLNHIDPMLTIDSYFSFVMTYILAGALLFQLPIIMLIINSVKPLTPSKMMSYQRHILVGSFIVAAVISPTPDVLNQTLLASPIVVMYQLGIILIWSKNASKARRERKAARVKKSTLHTGDNEEKKISIVPLIETQKSVQPSLPAKQATAAHTAKQHNAVNRPTIDGMMMRGGRPLPKLQTQVRVDTLARTKNAPMIRGATAPVRIGDIMRPSSISQRTTQRRSAVTPPLRNNVVFNRTQPPRKASSRLYQSNQSIDGIVSHPLTPQAS